MSNGLFNIGSSGTEADSKEKGISSANQEQEIDLYIGVFFDGTNNNKYQVMLGKMFRRKEIFEKAKKRQINDYDYLIGKNGDNVNSVNELLSMPRAEVEKDFPGLFTKSELEYLYFGYGNINNSEDNSYNTFIEEKNAKDLGRRSQNNLSAKPDNKEDCNLLRQTASNFANHKEIVADEEKETIEKFKGAPAQNATYTNVAILESIYKCGNKKNDDGEITERHISVYVEGSGADMQLEASTSNAYKATIGLAGLGLGTGPTGVVSKIRKASAMVKQIHDQYKCMNDINVSFHFDLFGFSRGATCARVMAYLINPDPNTNKAYTGNDRISDDDYLLLTSTRKEFLPIDDNIKGKEIRFMGIFDTVSSVGIKDEKMATSLLVKHLENNIQAAQKERKTDIPTIWNYIKPNILPTCKLLGSVLNDAVGEIVGDSIGNYLTDKSTEKIDPIIEEIKQYAQSNDYRDKGTEDIAVRPEIKSILHKDNVKDYGLWATCLAKDIVHICAMDEVRQNFALVDIQSSLDRGTGKEIIIPGCHTDIGGGAFIGMEGEKIINKGSDRYLTSYYVHSKSWLEKDGGDLMRPITVEALKEIGWLSPDSKATGLFKKTSTGRSKLNEDETYYSDNTIAPSNIIMYRHVSPGYSNIALNYMKENAARDTFYIMPKAYHVPKDLCDLYNQLKTIKSSGRFFVYPNQLSQYSELRRRYIHFSFNEQRLDIADNALVNGPEYTEIDNITKGKVKVISRIIYPGSLTDSDERHMFDYE